MPTAIARIGREKTVRTLAERLFVIEGPGKAEKLRRAERALLRDNPALATEEGFRSGAIVIVPSDIGLATQPRVERPGLDLNGMLQETTQRLRMADAVARARFAKARQTAEEAVTKLEDQAFLRKLKQASADAGKLAPITVKNIREQRAGAEKRAGEILAAIEEAIAEIDKLEDLPRDGT